MTTLIGQPGDASFSPSRLQTLDDACLMIPPGTTNGSVPMGCILTSDQRERLFMFKELCHNRDYNLSQPDSYTDDTALLRYLRARNFDVVSAFEQFDHATKWRRDHGIQEFYDNLDVDYYEESRKMYPQWIRRRDHDGHPIYVFAVKNFTKQKLEEHLKKISSCPTAGSHSQSDVPSYILHFHALYDNLI